MAIKPHPTAQLLVEGNNEFHVIHALCQQFKLDVRNRENPSGVWVMPNNDLSGMLENFIAFLIPKEDKLWPIVNSTLDHIEKEKINQYAAIHRHKAAIHTWLAWQEQPGSTLGQGITKRYLTVEQETCLQFIDWLRKLFENH